MKFSLNWFTGRTVASITASLSSIVKDLDAHVLVKIDEARFHNKAVEEARVLLEAAQEEIVSAKKAASKIAALFS